MLKKLFTTTILPQKDRNKKAIDKYLESEEENEKRLEEFMKRCKYMTEDEIDEYLYNRRRQGKWLI